MGQVCSNEICCTDAVQDNNNVMKPLPMRKKKLGVDSNVGSTQILANRRKINSVSDYRHLLPFKNTNIVSFVNKINTIAPGPLNSTFSIKDMARTFKQPVWQDHWQKGSELQFLLVAMPKDECMNKSALEDEQ